MIVKLSFIELRNYLFNKVVLIFWSLNIITMYLIPPYSDTVAKTKITLLYLFPLFMGVCFTQILSKEFENKTYKVLFTGYISRKQVVIYKLLTLFELSIILAVVYQIMLNISILADGRIFSLYMFFKGVISSIPVYLMYTFMVASFAMLLVTITEKFSISFIITYICFNDFLKILLNIVGQKSRNIILSSVMENMPFTVTAGGFSVQYYTGVQYITLLISSCILLFVTLMVIEKKDYR